MAVSHFGDFALTRHDRARLNALDGDKEGNNVPDWSHATSNSDPIVSRPVREVSQMFFLLPLLLSLPSLLRFTLLSVSLPLVWSLHGDTALLGLSMVLCAWMLLTRSVLPSRTPL
jgi:hypothetical protein